MIPTCADPLQLEVKKDAVERRINRPLVAAIEARMRQEYRFVEFLQARFCGGVMCCCRGPSPPPSHK